MQIKMYDEGVFEKKKEGRVVRLKMQNITSHI